MDLIERESELSYIFMTGGSFPTWSKASFEVKTSTFLQELENKDVIIFLDNYISKEWLLGPWERRSWVVILARSFKKTYLTKTQIKNSQILIF